MLPTPHIECKLGVKLSILMRGLAPRPHYVLASPPVYTSGTYTLNAAMELLTSRLHGRINTEKAETLTKLEPENMLVT